MNTLAQQPEPPGPRPHTRLLRVRFSTDPQDQALYAALRASATRAERHPLGWQIKFLLELVLGLRELDSVTLRGAGLERWDTLEKTICNSEERLQRIQQNLQEEEPACAAPQPRRREGRVLRLVPKDTVQEG